MTAVFGFEDVLPMQQASEPLRHVGALMARGELVELVATLVQTCDVLRRHYLELLAGYEHALHDLDLAVDERDKAVEEAGRLQTYLDQDGVDANVVVRAVRGEHDDHHHQPWAICEHQLCRIAGRWGW